jgi:hypothetical protein
MNLETNASKKESNNLPEVLAQEIVEDLEAALEQFREIDCGSGRKHKSRK